MPAVPAQDSKPVVSDSTSIDDKSSNDVDRVHGDAEQHKKTKKGGLGPVALIFACGAALFSDGYGMYACGTTDLCDHTAHG